MSEGRYGEPRQRAQLELRAAAAQFIVDAELMLRWLDELGADAVPASALEQRHAEVLRRARSVEAALNHVVSLERLARDRVPDAPPPPGSSPAPGANPEPNKARRTIPIVGDPNKPKPEPEHAHSSPTPRHDDGEDSGETIPAPQPFDAP